MAGDEAKAQEYQDSIASFRACFKYGNPNTIVKAAVAMLGYDVGPCRAPFSQIPPEGLAQLKKDVYKRQGRSRHRHDRDEGHAPWGGA